MSQARPSHSKAIVTLKLWKNFHTNQLTVFWVIQYSYLFECFINESSYTVVCRLDGKDYFGLKTRVITSLLTYKCWLIFMTMKQKKNSKWTTQKKGHFPSPPILNIFFQKFHGWVLGLVGLIDAKGIDGPQPIWRWESSKFLNSTLF